MKRTPLIRLECWDFNCATQERFRPLKLKCYTYDCPLCKGEGIVEFKQEDKTYPNAPCPACRFYELRKWLDRWCLDKNIAPWLWKFHRSKMKLLKSAIAKRFLPRRRPCPQPDFEEYLPKETDEQLDATQQVSRD